MCASWLISCTRRVSGPGEYVIETHNKSNTALVGGRRDDHSLMDLAALRNTGFEIGSWSRPPGDSPEFCQCSAGRRATDLSARQRRPGPAAASATGGFDPPGFPVVFGIRSSAPASPAPC